MGQIYLSLTQFLPCCTNFITAQLQGGFCARTVCPNTQLSNRKYIRCFSIILKLPVSVILLPKPETQKIYCHKDNHIYKVLPCHVYWKDFLNRLLLLTMRAHWPTNYDSLNSSYENLCITKNVQTTVHNRTTLVYFNTKSNGLFQRPLLKPY